MTEYDNFKKQISVISNKTKTEIRQVGDNAGENFVKTETQSSMQDYNRRMKEIGVVYFDSRSKLADVPFQYLWEAGRCYTLGYFISTISLCPAIVEYTWNADPRLKDIK